MPSEGDGCVHGRTNAFDCVKCAEAETAGKTCRDTSDGPDTVMCHEDDPENPCFCGDCTLCGGDE